MEPAPRREASGPGPLTAAVSSLVLWLVLIGFGGGCLAWYYGSIHYFPDIAWEEALSFLGVLSIIGGSLTVAFALLAFLPGVLWSEVLLEDSHLHDPLTYKRADNTLEPCLVSIGSVIGIPFAEFILGMHVLIFATGMTWRLWYLEDAARTIVIALSSLALLAATSYQFERGVTAALKTWQERGKGRAQGTAESTTCEPPPLPASAPTAEHTPPPAAPPAPEHPGASVATLRPQQSSIVKYLTAFVASELMGLAALLMLEDLFDDQKWDGYLLAIFCAVVVVATNIFVAALFHERRPRAILVAGLATILLLAVGEWIEGSDSVLHKIMESYGVGEGTHYVLVVTTEGGELLKSQELPVQSGGKGAPAILRNVAILSRLGDNFFLGCGDRRVSLSRSAVVSWSTMSSGDKRSQGGKQTKWHCPPPVRPGQPAPPCCPPASLKQPRLTS